MALAFFTVQAQIGAGTISVGGTLGVSSESDKYKNNSGSVDGPKTSTFVVGPKVGYFISDNFSIGASIRFSNTTEKSSDGNEKDITNRFTFAPFGRYHVFLSDKFYAFGEAEIGFGVGGGKIKNGGVSVDKNDITTLGIAISPGVIFMPSEKIGIELAVNLLSFNSNTSKAPNGNKSTSNIVSFGTNLFAPSLGIQFYF